MKTICVALIGLLAFVPISRAEAPAEGATHRVLIVSIDGLRPDLLLRANAPHARSLMARGSFSFWARTTEVSITLPSHVSMLTGVTPTKHHVTWNSDEPHPRQPFPAFPTLFELAKVHGLTTAAVTGKSKFSVLDKPGSLDWKSFQEVSDDSVAATAAGIIHEHRPQVMFVHFPDVDRIGHRDGWGSDTQVAAIEHADQELGIVLAAMDDVHVTASTLVILTADHGGAGRGHGPDDPRSRHIPWIAAGPGIYHNHDLTLNPRLVINTEDTFATSCHVLGIPLAGDIDGKPVGDIFASRELLHASP